ncbi:MAG: DUF6476 family protein [Shimia sp.]
MADPSDDDPAAADADAAALRGLVFLRRLVTVLTAVMILGVITIVALLVIRLQRPAAPALPPLPEAIALPEGVMPLSVTRSAEGLLVIARDGRMFVMDDEGRAVVRTLRWK